MGRGNNRSGGEEERGVQINDVWGQNIEVMFLLWRENGTHKLKLWGRTYKTTKHANILIHEITLTKTHKQNKTCKQKTTHTNNVQTKP